MQKNLFSKSFSVSQGDDDQLMASQDVAPVAQTPPPAQKPVEPESATSGMDYLSSLYTSPADEERKRRASLANQRILAVGDALRHIGNIATTVNYAPSQTFNSPVAEERQRYERDRALRDAVNMKYLAYRQQRDRQDLRRQELDRLDRQYQLAVNKQDWKQQYDQRMLELKQMHEEGVISDREYRQQVGWYNARTGRMRANNAASGGGKRKSMDEYKKTTETTYTYDEHGNRTGSQQTVTREVNNGKSQTTKKGNPYGGIRTPGKGRNFKVTPAN